MEKTKGRKKKEIDGTFAKILSKLLQEEKEKGISQDTIASQLEVSRQSLGKWANGVTVPDILDLRKIAKYFGVSTDYLLGISALRKSNLDLLQASKITNIPEVTLLKLSELYSMNNADESEICIHKNHNFYFFSYNTIDQTINDYIDMLINGFNKAKAELQEASNNGNDNKKDE